MNQTIFSIFHLSDEFLPYYIDELRRGKYQFLNGYPSAIYELANFLQLKEIQLNGIKAIYTSSETLFEWQRDAIEKAFGTKVYDFYSNAEQSIFAYQCEQGNYHVVPYYSAVWFKETGIQDEKGEKLYEVIGTSFINQSTFLINYATGDLVVLGGSDCCKCGRTGYLIRKIIGRLDDIIVTPDGRKIGRLDHLFKDSEDVKEAQIVQEAIDLVTIKIVLRKNTFETKNKVLHEAYKRIGNSVRIRIDVVPTIERTDSGKFRFVVSRITPQNICWRE